VAQTHFDYETIRGERFAKQSVFDFNPLEHPFAKSDLVGGEGGDGVVQNFIGQSAQTIVSLELPISRCLDKA
jgi:hypothetical protein